MKRALVLGAGQSTPFLIRHLLEDESCPVEVVVADREVALAQSRVGGHPRGRAVGIDAQDSEAVAQRIRDADVVLNLLAPPFQVPIARLCLELGRSMVSASYRSPELLALEPEAKARGLVLASELGLDPGLDHMSAMRLFDRVRSDGGTVERFFSYGGGLIDRGTVTNPFDYAITWNPRNVVMAGESGAKFVDGGRLRVVPYPAVFRRTWAVPVPELGTLEAYGNRDSVEYIETYGLKEADTIVRATLRYPGFCEAWAAIARLGLAQESLHLPELSRWRWRDLTETFLPSGVERTSARLSAELALSESALAKLEWLGLLDDTPIGDIAPEAQTPAEALAALMRDRLSLPPEGRDLVVLHHVIHAKGPRAAERRYTSTLLSYGEPSGPTAMAKTVGLPAGLCAQLILSGELSVVGCPIPTVEELYGVLLPRVEALGLQFRERQTDSRAD